MESDIGSEYRTTIAQSPFSGTSNVKTEISLRGKSNAVRGESPMLFNRFDKSVANYQMSSRHCDDDDIVSNTKVRIRYDDITTKPS